MDLGTKCGECDMPMAAAMPKGKENKMSFPSLNLNDEKASEFLKECEPELNDVITGTFTAKVSGLRQDQYGKSVTLDFLSMDDLKCAEAAGEAADDADEESEPEEKSPVKKAVRKMMMEES